MESIYTADTVPAVAESVKYVLDSGIEWIAALIAKAANQANKKPDTDAKSLALKIVAGIEGSILLARLGKDITILENAVNALKTELKASFGNSKELRM